MMRTSARRLAAVAITLALVIACASAPPPVVVPRRAVLSYEQKLSWILRLEEDRVLELPVSPPPPAVAPTPSKGAAAAPEPPLQPDLMSLLLDDEPRIRRRAALAIGRTRVAAGLTPLVATLSADADPEVRQMAAFALGLLGQAAAADALVTALADADPIVQGRAAEALGLIGHKPSAEAIGKMMATHVSGGAIANIAPDDLEYPKPPPVEAVRLGMYALVRLAAYEPLAAVLTDGQGNAVSRWWPVAYAFRRVGDPRAGTVLLRLLQSPGTFTRAFAARGLGATKHAAAVAPLVALLANESEVGVVRIEAARALAELGLADAVPALTALLKGRGVDPALRLEAVTALGQLRATGITEMLVDLATESWASLRAAALTALARVDPDTFLSALSGLDPDPHWSVRAAVASSLGSLDGERVQPRLVAMLSDSDQRVIPAVLGALVAVKAPEAEAALLERLRADDAVVRQAAASGLGRLKSPKGALAIADVWETAEKDPTYVARAAMMAALVELDREVARPILNKALSDRDWAVRVRAAALLRTIDPAADVSSMRPAPAAVLPELNDLPALANPPVTPTAYIDTEKGLIQIELAVIDAPRTVANFTSLARRNFLGATPFHRIVPNFVAQDGDPRGDGEGGPGYTIRDEINQRPYLRGTVGMALDWEDTGGSQFFITLSPQPHLDGRYTVFGQVISGIEVVDQLMQWDQVRSVRIWDGVNWIGGQ